MSCKRVLLLFCTVLVLVSCSGGGDEAVTEERKTDVSVMKVVRENVRDTFTLPGTVEAWELANLSAEVAGPVRVIALSEGDRVRQGQVILRLDTDALEADLAMKRATYTNAKKTYDRMKSLLADRSISQSQFDNAESAFLVAEAELRRAEVTLDQAIIESPFSGILDDVAVDRGEYVAPGVVVATVVRLDRLKIEVQVPEKDVRTLSVGDNVSIEHAVIDGASPVVIQGRINHIAFVADARTRTYATTVEVTGDPATLRPGMITRMRFNRRTLENVIAVPLYSVIDRGSHKAVFVVVDGKAVERAVVTGPAVRSRIVIEEGLTEGERLIVRGQHLVADGSSVYIAEE